jgi:hypothetical protein
VGVEVEVHRVSKVVEEEQVDIEIHLVQNHQVVVEVVRQV